MKAAVLTVLLSGMLASCGDTGLVGVHVWLEADGSGTVTTRSLLLASESGPMESRTVGVNWDRRANLYSSQGLFTEVTQMRIGEIRFQGGARRDETPLLRVIIPRGPEVEWLRSLVPDAQGRKDAATVYDPSKKTREVAETIQFEIYLPDSVVSVGVDPQARGVETDKEGRSAYLWIPVATATEKGNELIWDITWK